MRLWGVTGLNVTVLFHIGASDIGVKLAAAGGAREHTGLEMSGKSVQRTSPPKSTVHPILDGFVSKCEMTEGGTTRTPQTLPVQVAIVYR